MPRLVDRYILAELGAPFALGVAVFTFFLVIDRVYHLTDLVITRGVPFHLVLGLLVFMLPAFLTLTLPLAFLVAALLACARLGTDRELIALTAAGVTPLRLFRPFAAAALAVAALSASLTVVVGPWASGAFQRQLFAIVQARAASAIKERTFSTALGQFVVYARDISPSGVALRDLIVSDERDPTVSRIIVSREGRLLTDETGNRVTFRFLDGDVTETSPGDRQRFRRTAFTLYDMNLTLDAKSAPGLGRDRPERQLGAVALAREIASRRERGEPVAAFRVELHKRLSLPLTALVFVMVGFPLAVRSPRGGRGLALATSLGIVVGYYALFVLLEGLAVREQMPAALAIWLPNVIFFLIGLGLLGTTIARPTSGRGLPLWRLVEAARRLRRTRSGAGADGRPGGPRGRRASTFIIDRYLIREYLRYMGIGLAVGAVLVLVGDLLQTLDRLLRVRPPLLHIVEMLAFRLPGALYQGLPVVVLIATVFLFLSLSRQHELDALKAAGVSLYRTAVPVLLVASAVSVGAGLFQETLLPDISARADEIDRVKIRGGLPRHLQRRTQIWYRASDTRFFRLDLLDPVARAVDGLTLMELDDEFRLRRRVDAARALWTPAGWELSSGAIRDIGPDGTLHSAPFERMRMALPEHIDDFIQVQKPPETMSFRELRAYVAKLRENGRDVGRYAVDLYGKLSFPLVDVVMALVAIPFALASPRSGGRALGIALAVAIGASYWLVNAMAISFAKADLLPPLLAAWTANVVFAGLGAALLLRART